ncbi:MAG: imidazole glycerol phosphate synthase subunit HisH [Myxococcales bacterium]|nr:imidazole glycerol phosphate synthase subunit HisH [Myxococcales bacterium]
MARIAVIDYGAGNVASVLRALRHLGADAEAATSPVALRSADAIVFPGQGHFGQAARRLLATGMWGAVDAACAEGRPFLGICLGLQLLAEGSDEAPGVKGLGRLRGHSVAFCPPVKVPQIGWNAVHAARRGTLLDAVPAGSHFYFVHSYHCVLQDERDVAGTAEHGLQFVAAVERDRLCAVQFHPEKSGAVGLALLRAWLALHGMARETC